MSHRSKRQNRKGPSRGMSLSSPFGQPGQPGQIQPGGHGGQPSVSWTLGTPPVIQSFSQSSISVPSGYPFWQQPPSGQPGQPGQPGQQPGSGAYVPPPRLQKHTKHESTSHGPLPPGKRQRFQSISGVGDVPQHPLAGSSPPSYKPGQSGQPGLANGAPITPLLPFSSGRPPWVLDSPARAHFPHSSLSFPLPSPAPRSAHFPKESISYPSKLSLVSGPPSSRRLPPSTAERLQATHARAPSVNLRVGPPPKAILGGPGGRTFDELSAPTPTRSVSLEVRTDTSRRGSFEASSVGSTVGSPQKSAISFPLAETKYMGKTVHVTLPPEKYSPPDSPMELDDTIEASADGQIPPPRLSRKETFPWPASKVRVSPTSIPLPLSPTEADLELVEGVLGLEDSPDKGRSVDAELESPSLVPTWVGKEVVFSLPSQSSWERLRPLRRSGPSETDQSADDRDAVDAEIDLSSNEVSGNEQSGRTSPLGSTTWATAVDESIAGMSPQAFTALQEPWPPSRSWTPSEPGRPDFSPITEDRERELEESDTDTAIVSSAQKDHGVVGGGAHLTKSLNTVASPGIDTPSPPPPVLSTAVSNPPSSPPEPPVVPPNTAESPLVPPNPPNTAVNADEPPLTAIPLDPSARFPVLDTDSAMSPPQRRTFGINPFLKRSLGGMLRDTPRTRSASSSVDHSHAPSHLASASAATGPVSDDERAMERIAANGKQQENVQESEILPGEEADEEDNADEHHPKTEGAVLADVPSEAATVVASRQESPKLFQEDAGLDHVSADLVQTDTDPSTTLTGESPTRSRRPTGIFSNAAFRRQVQGFLRSDAAPYQPTPKTSDFPHKEGEEHSPPPSPAPAAPEAIPTTAEESRLPCSQDVTTLTVSPAAIHRDIKSTPSPTETTVSEPLERPRSPPRDPTATKKLKATAPVFRPSAPVFKPTAPIFNPTAPVFSPGAAIFNPGASVFVPKPMAAPFVPQKSAPVFVPRSANVTGPPPSQHQSPAMNASPVTRALTPTSTTFLSKSPSGLRPTALPFVPGGGMTFGAPLESTTGTTSSDGGALGLFTFTHKLRPVAQEFKPAGGRTSEHKANPRMGSNGTPYRPPPLDLSRSEPASRAFELLGTQIAIEQDAQDEDVQQEGRDDAVNHDEHEVEQADTAHQSRNQEGHEDHEERDQFDQYSCEPDTANSEAVVRRHSFKDTSSFQRSQELNDSDTAKLGRRHSFKASTDLQPWRLEASPRAVDVARSEHSASEVGVIEDEHIEEPRESPRRRTHTAKRSSQNSYLSRAMISKSSPSSPVKPPMKDSPSPASLCIVRSRPLRARNSSGPWLSPQSETFDESQLAMPDSADEYSPIAPVPSDIDGMSDTTGPGDALKESMMEREHISNVPKVASQGTAGVRSSSISTTTLNPGAKPFVFGAPVPPAAEFTISSSPRPAARAVEEPGTPSPPSIQVELADENKFRKWTFPTGAAPSNVQTRTTGVLQSHHAHKRSHSDMSMDNGTSPAAELHGLSAEEFEAEASASEVNEEDVEWRTWHRHKGAEGTAQLPESPEAHSSTEFPLRSSPPRVLTVVNGNVTSTSQRGLLPLSPGPQPSVIERDDTSDIMDGLQRIEQQIGLLTLNYNARSKDDEHHMQKAQSECDRALDLLKDNMPPKRAFENIINVLETQTELLQAVHRRIDKSGTGQPAAESPINAMIKAMLSSQNTVLDKIGEFSEAQEAIYELHSATNGLLEAAQEDIRAIRSDRAQGMFQTKAINELQNRLVEETNRSREAEKEIALLKAQLVEANERAKAKETEESRHRDLKSDIAATNDAVARATRAEELAREELSAMREVLAKQTAEHAAAVEALRGERLLAEERQSEMIRLQTESTAFKHSILERFDLFESRMQSSASEKVLSADKDTVAALEKEVEKLRVECTQTAASNADLRVQLTQALADVKFEQEKAIRIGDEEANSRRSLDLQLKGEKARTSFLENKVQKLETELHDVNQNLDVWRSAALEQRLRAEQSAAHLSAMQQENFHWREFALGADRYRLEQWLATKPFHDGVSQTHSHGHSHGQSFQETPQTPSARATRSTTPTQSQVARPLAHSYPQAGSPLKHAASVPAIVVPE